MSKSIIAILTGATAATATRMTDFSVIVSNQGPILQSADFSEKNFQAIEIAIGKKTAILAMTEVGLLAIVLKKDTRFKSAALVNMANDTISKLVFEDTTLVTKKAKTIQLSQHIRELVASTFPTGIKATDDMLMASVSIDGKDIVFTPSLIIEHVLATGKASQYSNIESILVAANAGTLVKTDDAHTPHATMTDVSEHFMK